MTDKTREEFIAWAKKYNPKNWTSALWAWKYQQNIIDALRVENAELRATIINAKGYLESNEIAWALQELRG